MLAVVVILGAVAVAIPFLWRLRRGFKAVDRAAHFQLQPLPFDPYGESSPMRAATCSLANPSRPAPLIVVHRYRRHGVVATGLTVVGRHPERIAALIAGAAGAVAEPIDHLDLPAGGVIRYGRRAHRSAKEAGDVGHQAFSPWVTSVLAAASHDAVLSIGVTPAARWEAVRAGAGTPAGWRGRVVAAAGDPITADALAAGWGTQLPDLPVSLGARRIGDGPLVAGGAGLALATGLVTGGARLVSLHLGAAAAALETGVVAAVSLTVVGASGILRVTESCWRHWQRYGVVVPERPWRLSLRRAAVRHRNPLAPPTTRRTVGLTADHWAALCAPGPARGAGMTMPAPAAAAPDVPGPVVTVPSVPVGHTARTVSAVALGQGQGER
jgi:hypothetical protein